jgi:hypothetical protein
MHQDEVFGKFSNLQINDHFGGEEQKGTNNYYEQRMQPPNTHYNIEGHG